MNQSKMKKTHLIIFLTFVALIGTQTGHDHKVYWEFGRLKNKHMLIQGKSGAGKTYFIQRMLKELSNQGVPSIIIDYTDGFRSDQLEPAFLESLEDKNR